MSGADPTSTWPGRRRMTTDPANMEAMAAAEHESWAKWTKWMLSEIEREVRAEGKAYGDGNGELIVGRDGGYADVTASEFMQVLAGLPSVKRWRRQIVTPYAKLSEGEKESDRKVVREKLPVYRPDAGHIYAGCVSGCPGCAAGMEGGVQ